MLEDLILKTRSYRRFDESARIEIETLRDLVKLARFSASGSNRQPLKFVLSCDPETNAAIFPHTRWAGYLTDWGGPAEGERPTAYIIILGDTEIREAGGVDHGIAAQSIMLGATERGLGGCMIGSIDKPKLRKQIRKLEKKLRTIDKRARKTERKVDKVRALKQSRLNKPGKARITARTAERERAEGQLASAITQMLSVSKQRAGAFGAASTRTFARPVRGTITQPYGCTGYRAKPARGSCRHFHDGIDIAAKSGTGVRVSANGYVAFVGYSPWDPGSRAFIVVVGHSNGYETVYAHLKPIRKVRAGQRVTRGDVIGLIGMSGTTSGPHVHWEVKTGRTTVNPLRAGR